jgi:hypothetical protein
LNLVIEMAKNKGGARTGPATAGEIEKMESILQKVRRAYSGQKQATEAFEKVNRGKTRSKANVQQGGDAGAGAAADK